MNGFADKRHRVFPSGYAPGINRPLTRGSMPEGPIEDSRQRTLRGARECILLRNWVIGKPAERQLADYESQIDKHLSAIRDVEKELKMASGSIREQSQKDLNAHLSGACDLVAGYYSGLWQLARQTEKTDKAEAVRLYALLGEVHGMNHGLLSKHSRLLRELGQPTTEVDASADVALAQRKSALVMADHLANEIGIYLPSYGFSVTALREGTLGRPWDQAYRYERDAALAERNANQATAMIFRLRTGDNPHALADEYLTLVHALVALEQCVLGRMVQIRHEKDQSPNQKMVEMLSGLIGMQGNALWEINAIAIRFLAEKTKESERT